MELEERLSPAPPDDGRQQGQVLPNMTQFGNQQHRKEKLLTRDLDLVDLIWRVERRVPR